MYLKQILVGVEVLVWSRQGSNPASDHSPARTSALVPVGQASPWKVMVLGVVIWNVY